MAGKATGKYYAQVYRAKKSPAAVRRGRLVRRCVILAVAVIAVAVMIAAVKISRSDGDSFVQVAASEKSLSDVSSYPRIVDAGHPLPEDYAPDDLMSLATLPNGEGIFLRTDAAEAFFEMCASMSTDGLGIVPLKGYVSYESQKAELDLAADRLVAEGTEAAEAVRLASEQVSAPGEDEAQLGTTVEISTDLHSADSFGQTEQYQWICRNAARYGFIIRYTASGSKYTGVSAQPWRLRYVGRDAAEYMASHGICLEQYVKLVKSSNADATEE